MRSPSSDAAARASIVTRRSISRPRRLASASVKPRVAILHQPRHRLAMPRNPGHGEDDQHHGQRQDRPQEQLNAQTAQLTQHDYLSSSTIQPSLSAVVTASVRELTASLP